MNIKINKEAEELLQIGNKLVLNEKDSIEEWYYFPFWMRKVTENGGFEMVTFEKLPERVIKRIESLREL